MPIQLRRPTPTAFRSQRRRQLMLSTDEVAAMCRAAYLSFVNGEAWGKRELAQWLLQHYRPIAGPPRDSAPASAPRLRADVIHPIRLRAFIDETRAALLEDLLGMRSETHRVTLERRALEMGLVAPERDVTGRTCYVPVDLPEARLIDRLRALVVADALANGDELAHLIICNACSVVGFDPGTPPSWVCSHCNLEHSGMRMRSDFAMVLPHEERAWFKAG